MLINESIDYILDNGKTINNCIDELIITKFVNIITESDNILIFGSGRSGLIAKTFAMRLMQLGLNAFAADETIAPTLSQKSCVLIVSSSGKNKSLISTIKKKGIKSLAITSNSDSYLGLNSDYVITFKKEPKPTNSKVNHGYLAPLGTIFEINSLILLDGLIAELMKKLKKIEKDLEDKHESFAFIDYYID